MYFNEIYNKIYLLWKKRYRLSYGNSQKTFVPSISAEYRRVSYLIDFEYKHLYSEWESMLVFTMFGTLTDKGIFYLDKNTSKYLNIDEISIEEFERYYLDNLKEEGNEEYLSKYKGLW